MTYTNPTENRRSNKGIRPVQWTQHFFVVSSAILLSIVCLSCKTQKDSSSPLSQVSVQWELLQNTEEPTYGSETRFIFSNTGKDTVRGGNWFMEYNMDTYLPSQMADSTMGIVSHINGYVFHFTPGTAFQIPPGQSVAVNYSNSSPIIKASAGPIGAFFVESDESGNERIITLQKPVEILGYDDLSRVFPSEEIRATVPTAASEYQKNSSLTKLLPEQTGLIIPTPQTWIRSQGNFTINKTTLLQVEKGLESEASYLAQALKERFGISIEVQTSQKASEKSIYLGFQPTKAGKGDEDYEILCSEMGIQVRGNQPAGVFYGIQSMLATIPASAYGTSQNVNVPAMTVFDTPRFAYRGFLLDVARNFTPKKELLKLIDLLAMYKVNKLNLRITEDEGWRIEIKGLPELTQIGSRRGYTKESRKHLLTAFGSGPDPDSPGNKSTGYYTREEFKEILKYAAQRHVEVIPEVCFPSHARAAIMAMEARYDTYMKKGEKEKAEEFRLIDPQDTSRYYSAQKFRDNIACAARPSVYHFYETVIKDFIDMYQEAGLKLKTFNTGGDEVPKGAWSGSPMCLDLMKTMPEIRDPLQFQGYFLGKALEILKKYGLRTTGWEEVVLNKDSQGNVQVNPKFIGQNVYPLVWDNTGNNIDLGNRIANAGYPVILCNVTNLYFDLSYTTDPTEKGLHWGGFQDAIDPYVLTPLNVYNSTNFDWFGRLGTTEVPYPGKERLKAENRKNIYGLQAQLWSETLVDGPEQLEYYVLPKLFAFAEKSWAQAPAWEEETDVQKRVAQIRTSWNEFTNRIGQHEMPRLDLINGGYAYRIPSPGGTLTEGRLYTNVSFPGLEVRYTTDGSEPSATSALWSEPVAVEGSIRIRAFNKKGRGGKSFVIQ